MPPEYVCLFLDIKFIENLFSMKGVDFVDTLKQALQPAFLMPDLLYEIGKKEKK